MEQLIGTPVNQRMQELKQAKILTDKKHGLTMPVQTNHPIDKIINAACVDQEFSLHNLINDKGSDSKRGWIKNVICYIAYKNGVNSERIMEALSISQQYFNAHIRFSILTYNSDENYRRQVQKIELSIDHGFDEKVKRTPVNSDPVKISHLDLLGKPLRKMTLEYFKANPEMGTGLTVGDVKI